MVLIITENLDYFEVILRNSLDYFEVLYKNSQYLQFVKIIMKRLYQTVFNDHLIQYRQMLFVMGPRQSGKTTAAQALIKEQGSAGFYFNWDNINDRDYIVKGPSIIAQRLRLDVLQQNKPWVVFDEIHKFKHWRDFLKGFYDSYPDDARILVTGSAKLHVFSRGGDSLMGRYFPFHFHPLSVAELSQTNGQHLDEFWAKPAALDDEQYMALWHFGGFPDPFLNQTAAFSRRWRVLRHQQLFDEDIRDLTRIQEIDRLELLAEKLKQHVGALVSYQSLAQQLRVSDNTIRHWVSILKALYYCFDIRPWSTNVVRSLLKEPKYYLWDWSLCVDDGSRAENMMALHLLKAIHFWNDLGMGDYQLHFLRDKEKREVDFLVTKNNIPWMLIEVKVSNDQRIASSLRYFHEQLKPEFSFQVVFNMPYVDVSCFQKKGAIMIVPAKTFLSQLV